MRVLLTFSTGWTVTVGMGGCLVGLLWDSCAGDGMSGRGVDGIYVFVRIEAACAGYGWKPELGWVDAAKLAPPGKLARAGGQTLAA